MLNFYVKVIIIFIVLNFTNKAFAYTKLFEPNVPNDINVHISWKYLKEYSDYINQITKNPTSPIPSKYKKKFKSKVYYKNKYNELSILPANTRITGDWQDHIDSHKKISSLKINLREGNIGNIVKFRLLLSKTRDFEAEIFWTILHEVLGYPVLYKKIVNVSMNGLPAEKMLFEESASKEFLERFSIRETAILETDERYFWDNKFSAFKNCSSLMELISAKERDKCVEDYLKKIDFEKYNIWPWKVDNKSFLKNKMSYKIGITAILHSNDKNTKNQVGFNALNSKLANHSLNKNNLKKIFDPTYNFYVPLYYDGDITKINFKKFCKEHISNNYKKEQLNELENLYVLRTGDKLNNNFSCVAKYYLSDPKYQFSLNKILNNNDFKLNKSENDNLEKRASVRTDETFENLEICLKEGDCIKIKNENNIVRDTIAGDYIFLDKKNKKNYPRIIFKKNLDEKKIITNLDNINKNFYEVAENETLFIKFDNFNQDLQFNLNGIYSKVVIFNSQLEDSKIKIKYLKKNKEKIYDSNYDENLLTGCLTIIDSNLKNISIESDYSHCEDSLNIVRSKGSISNLSLKNSQFDLVDFDFSNIKINKAILNNSKNDCLDFSYGNYFIEEITASDCKDKALSVGEKSMLKINNFKGFQNNLDIAIKDSSLVVLKNFSSDKTNNENCISIYKKKQEFDGGTLSLNKKEFDCIINKDLHSKVTLDAKK